MGPGGVLTAATLLRTWRGRFFLLTGVEDVEIDPGNTAMTPLASTTHQPQPAYEGDVGGAGRDHLLRRPGLPARRADLSDNN
jgi:hypothetical protein